MDTMADGYTPAMNQHDAEHVEVTDEMIAARAKDFMEAGCLEAVNSELMFLRTELSKDFAHRNIKIAEFDEVLKKHIAKAVDDNNPIALGALMMSYLRPAAEHEAEIMAEESLCLS